MMSQSRSEDKQGATILTLFSVKPPLTG